MPLYKSIAVNDETHVLIWHITENEQVLNAPLTLETYSKNRLSNMKSELHRRAYLSVRHLLAIANYTDADLTYNEDGKPHLSDGVYISITHSYEYAAIILSAAPVGIDIEKQREKIIRIASKFVSDQEMEYLNASESEFMKKLTVLWGAKEAVYKLYGMPGVSFKQHIVVAPFELHTGITKSLLSFNEVQETYETDFLEFEGFTCVYTF